METNLSISFELIYFINWLLKHHKKDLNFLVKKAMKNGFGQELNNIDDEKYLQMTQGLPVAILEFLFYLEDSILRNLDKVESAEKTQENLLPTLKKIDTQNIDMKTLWLTLQQTKSTVLKDKYQNISEKKQNSKEILTETLLKNWNPGQDETLN